MSTLELKVYEIFKNKLGEKEAEAVIEYIEVKAEEKYQQKKDVLATKEDLANTKAEIIKWMFIFWIGTIGVLSGDNGRAAKRLYQTLILLPDLSAE